MSDPRKARTLDEACSNGDGTYNGYRLLSWLSEVMNPGHGISEAEIREFAHERGSKVAHERVRLGDDTLNQLGVDHLANGEARH